MIVKHLVAENGFEQLVWKDPATGEGFCVPIKRASAGRPCWQWNGSLEKPTLNPSVLQRVGREGKEVNHFFMRDGRIEYCGDSTHASAGKALDMVELPDYLRDW